MSDEELMSCEEAVRLLAEFLDGELHGGPHDAVERHLAACRGCASRAEFEQRLKVEIGRLRHAEVSASFDDRVRHLLDSFSPSAPEPSDS
jgi:anti-sigma factor (TIGR02949 family)